MDNEEKKIDEALREAFRQDGNGQQLSADFTDRLMRRIHAEDRHRKTSHLWRRVAAIALIAILVSGLSYAGISHIVSRSGLPHLKPSEVNTIPTISRAEYEQLSEKMDSGQLSQQAIDSRYAGLSNLYWPGCSWYCLGEYRHVTASSCLSPMGKKNYSSDNLYDWNHETAWVEGVDGSGKGETITFTIAGRSWPITSVNILNGYVKTERAWRENNRVKQLKMYVNGQPYALLDLEDSRAEQVFPVDSIGKRPAGMSDEEWSHRPDYTIKFEIRSVYRGEKYDDTAISELFFCGPALH
ncbi:MAG: hypothetical protein IJ539_02045 [Prevotella sp.]|nr:hypothetical protein [Prevotella sp.]